MSYFFAFYLFILGVFIGSFLNVLVDRIPRNEKLTGRSHCESCKKTLSWKDLIPLISFVYLKGKCRYCHRPLSYQYPALEIITGLMFALTYLLFTIHYLPIEELIFDLFIGSIMIVIFFTDLKHGIIPDKILLPAVIITGLYLLLTQNSSFIIHIASAFGSLLFFLAIYLLTRRHGMGFGDVKFALLIGLILGFPGTIYALYIAFLTGAILGIILVVWKKKKLGHAVPFGPFLVLGTLVSFLFQDQIRILINLLFT